MNPIAEFFSIFLMIITAYFLFKFFYKKDKIKDNLSEQEPLTWEKARVGLFFTIPLIFAILTILNITASSRVPMGNVGPAILNFFFTRFVVKKIIKKGLSFNYPKLYTIGISIVIYIIQLTLGTVLLYLLKI